MVDGAIAAGGKTARHVVLNGTRLKLVFELRNFRVELCS
jgi:hypothetical protein